MMAHCKLEEASPPSYIGTLARFSSAWPQAPRASRAQRAQRAQRCALAAIAAPRKANWNTPVRCIAAICASVRRDILANIMRPEHNGALQLLPTPSDFVLRYATVSCAMLCCTTFLIMPLSSTRPVQTP